MSYVNNIEVENFYNYKSKIKYEFKSGLNIVVADNNCGKSKLYNAFNWILSDRVFDSDARKYYEVVNSNKKGLFKIISDKAKSEAKLGATIVTKVVLEFTNDLNVEQVNKYRIIKSISATLNSEGHVFDLNNWEIRLNKSEYFHEDIIESRPITEERVKGMLYPEALKHYFLFQGEEVDNLVGNQLTNAIQEIHGTWMYDYMGNFLEDLADKADLDFNKQANKNSKDKIESKKLEIEIRNLKESIKQKEELIRNRVDDLEIKNKEKTLSDNELLDLKKQNQLIEQLSKCETIIEKCNEDIMQFEKIYNDNFIYSQWLLLGLDSINQEYVNLRKIYKDNKLQEKVIKQVSTFSTNLPKGSPDIVSLKQMINDGECFVCGRKIEKNSDAHLHLIKLIEHYTPKKIEKSPPDFVDEFLDELYKSFNNYPTSKLINNDKESLKKEYSDLCKKIKDTSIRANELKQNQKYELDDFDKKWKDHNSINNDISKLTSEIERFKNDVERARTELDRKEKALANLATTIDIGYEKKKNILRDLDNAFKRTVNRKYKNLGEELQSNINVIYNKLTEGSETNPGYVKISVNDNKKFSSELQNNQGGLLTGQGTAFQRMKQLSIIMGIIKMKAVNDNNYPLIADAPVSEMGEILTTNLFYIVPDQFYQSILFVKDLYRKNDELSELNEFGKSLVKNEYLNPRVYLNTAIGKDQHERNTCIQLISEGRHI